MTSAFPQTGKVRLRTNLADYPVVRALKAGEVRSDLVELDFCGARILTKKHHAVGWVNIQLGAAQRNLEDARLSIAVSSPVEANKALAALIANRIELGDFALGNPSLDEVFVALTGHATSESWALLWLISCRPPASNPSLPACVIRILQRARLRLKAAVPDNLKAGITRPSRYEPGINRTYQDLADHYGFVVLPPASASRATRRRWRWRCRS